MNLSEYHKERRRVAKLSGICIQCNESQSEPERTKCADCRASESAKRERTPRNYRAQGIKGWNTRRMFPKTP